MEGSLADPELSRCLAEALRDSRHLVRAEAALARAELHQELRRAAQGALALVAGVSLLTSGLCLGLAVGCAALGGSVVAAALIGLALGVLGGGVAAWGHLRLASFSLAMPCTREALARNAAVFDGVGNSRE